MFTVLEIAPDRNGWAAAIIRTWASPGDRARAVARLERTIEHRQMLGLQIGRAFDRVLLVDVGQDRFDLAADRSRAFFKRRRHRLVDDLQHAAAGQLLVLDQRDVGLDARRVAIHQEADRAGRSQHRGLGIAEAVLPAAGQHFVPHVAGRVLEIGRAGVVDLFDRVAVHLHHAQHRLAVFGIAVERADGRGQFGAGQIGRPVQQGGHRAAQAAGPRPNRTARPLAMIRLPRFE